MTYRKMTLLERVAPFGALLEARYAPLLFVALPQSYTIYKWLYSSDSSVAGWVFAIAGAISFEFVYVGAIAWSESRTKTRWVWGTAVLALLFSMMVALRVYVDREGWWSVLHMGFPIVCFGYTLVLHFGSALEEPTVSESKTTEAPVVPVPAPVEPLQDYSNYSSNPPVALEPLIPDIWDEPVGNYTVYKEIPAAPQINLQSIKDQAAALGRQLRDKKLNAKQYQEEMDKLFS